MTRRHAPRPDAGTARPATTSAATAPRGHDLLALQRRAGNSAVQSLVQRDAAPGQVPSFSAAGSLATLGQMSYKVTEAVDRWLESQRDDIRLDVMLGATSMPEVVDRIRRSVPEAADASPFGLEGRVVAVVGQVPAGRGPGPAAQQAQLSAQLANLFSKVPTKVEVAIGPGELTVGITGAEFAVPNVGKVSATPGGAEAEGKIGPVTVEGEGSWAEKSGGFGFKTSAGPVKLSGKVEVEEGWKWKWSGGFSLPLAGSAVGKLPDLSKAVYDANAAITGAARHVASGGSPTDPQVTGSLGKAKPALDALGKVADHGEKTGVSLGVTASGGQDGGWTAGVSLVIVF